MTDHSSLWASLFFASFALTEWIECELFIKTHPSLTKIQKQYIRTTWTLGLITIIFYSLAIFGLLAESIGSAQAQQTRCEMQIPYVLLVIAWMMNFMVRFIVMVVFLSIDPSIIQQTPTPPYQYLKIYPWICFGIGAGFLLTLIIVMIGRYGSQK